MRLFAKRWKNDIQEWNLGKRGYYRNKNWELPSHHKGGNEYSGILETNEEGEKFKYTVKVIYDGENMQWEIIE